MEQDRILHLLQQVRDGSLSPEHALARLKIEPFEDLGYAKVDHHRALRQGVPEVIFGSGKTAEQIVGIVRAMRKNGQSVLITRLDAEKARAVSEQADIRYDPVSRIAVSGEQSGVTAPGYLVVAAAGTSDLPVAEEAAVTAEALGNRVERLYDALAQARVVIAAAGMEGALASVIGGLVSCPVIAVPTSIGYGANFGGLSALLSMLNSCASGVSVVNIDNGFGAGYLASIINHMGGADK